MKKTLAPLSLILLLLSCNNSNDIPDVSGVKVNIIVERFDRDFFALDTNDIPGGIQKLQVKYPGFTRDFLYQVLGVQDEGQDPQFIVKDFIRSYAPIQDSLMRIYRNTDWLEKELTRAYQFVKYYFRDYKPGKVVLFTGPFDAPGVAMTNEGIAIGLQQFAGKNFQVYQTAEAQELFPLYISRRFAPEYITANSMKAVTEDLFPDKSKAKPLIEQMVEKGKRWYLLDKFMPHAPDSVKTGFTGRQLEWCKVNEGLIWTYLVKNEDLNSVNPIVLQTYIGDAPFTQGFSQEESPGNIGQWIGWQIMKKFISKNPEMKPAEVMNTDARKILDEAKYKPR